MRSLIELQVDRMMKKDDYWNYKAGNKVMDKFNLLELFSSEMKPAEFKKACLEVYKVVLLHILTMVLIL